MSKVTLDADLKVTLNGLNEMVEICDEAGKKVGYYLPEDLYKKFVYAWINAQVTDEELEQAKKETGGRMLAEIWKSLGRT